MSEDPGEIRQKVMQEELAKGSDPRVAEARAKAAEARAKEGLPIDPQQAWPLKLERAGRTVSEAPAAPAAPAEPAEPAAQEPETRPAAEAPVVEAPAPEPEPQPSVEAPAAAAPMAPPEPEVVPVPFDPEVGEPIDRDDEVLTSVGGISVRDSRIPAWLMVVLVLIPLWAAFYLITLGAGSVEEETTGCKVSADRTFVCFQPDDAGSQEQTPPGH